MNFTFSSLFTTTFYSSLLIILVYFMLKKESRIRLVGVRTLILCILLSLIKLIFPFEFFCSHNIYLTLVYPKIYQFIKRPIMLFHDKTILPLDILCFVWSVGIIFFLTKFAVAYIRMSIYIKNLKPIKDQKLYSMLNHMIGKNRKHIHFRFVSSETRASPFVFGIFRPCIVLPKTFDIDDKNLYFIVSHEIAHYYNGDLILKFVLSLLRAVYWWNLFMNLLQNQLIRLLEINIDKTVTRDWSDSQKLDYLSCLVESAKDDLTAPCKDEILSFQSGSPLMVSQRVKIMMEDIDAPNKFSLSKSVALLLLSMLLFFIPVFTTFEAWVVPENEQEIFTINSKNAFFIINENGTYDIYLDNNYAGTVTEIFDSTIPIKERSTINEIQ
ncbi:MAG: M56 family metallopeptidase [Lachnospiraceae bacterium]|nr:M56 family metallopeptidase [Lachnospiraceae bacterium]